MNSSRRISRLDPPCLLLLAVAFIAGCGSNDPFSYVRARGKVTYDDGTPIPGKVRLAFQPEAPPIGNEHPHMGEAEANEQGEFNHVTSHKYADGLLQGKHKVAFSLGGMDVLGRPNVPKEYTDFATTPLEVDTKDLPFDIKIPKPTGAESAAKSK